MRLHLAIHALAFVLSFLGLVNAARKPSWGLRCAPYCSNRRLRVGARGPCINTCFAISCKGKAGILTYAPGLINSNRRRSGCAAQSTSPCSRLSYGNSGNSCDEYPIASSSQGGSGSILRCVPSVENSSQGAQLRAYVQANNVRPGDTFRQLVVLIPGSLPYCPNSRSCTNDGYEFLYNGNGRFSNARHEVEAEDDASYVGAIGGSEVEPLPVFRTSGGHFVTLWEDGDVPLNSTVWIDGDDGGGHTIVRQLNAEEIHQLAVTPAVDKRQSC